MTAIAVPCTGRPISRRVVRRRQPHASRARLASATPARRTSIGTSTVAATYLSRNATPMNRMIRPSLATRLPVNSHVRTACSQPSSLAGAVRAGAGGGTGAGRGAGCGPAGCGGAALLASETASEAAGAGTGGAVGRTGSAGAGGMGGAGGSAGPATGAGATGTTGSAGAGFGTGGDGGGTGGAACARGAGATDDSGAVAGGCARCSASSRAKRSATCRSSASMRPLRPLPTSQAARNGYPSTARISRRMRDSMSYLATGASPTTGCRKCCSKGPYLYHAPRTRIVGKVTQLDSS